MSADLKPALTKEQWADVEHERLSYEIVSRDPEVLHAQMALANSAFDSEDRRKITRADVMWLQRVVDLVEWGDLIGVRYCTVDTPAEEIKSGAETAISKLAALLPPEPA